MLDAFGDDRYIKVEGKPLLVVFNPGQLPDPIRTTDLWRTLAVRAGLKGLYLVGARNAPWNPSEHGFDAQTTRSLGRVETIERRIIRGMKWRVERFMHWPRLFSYGRSLPFLLMPEATQTCYYPAVIQGWDNTPRSGRNGLVLHGSTPELFSIHLRASITQIRHKPAEHRILFLKSWNEWAEGNYVEPDLRYGKGYLQVLRDEICRV